MKQEPHTGADPCALPVQADPALQDCQRTYWAGNYDLRVAPLEDAAILSRPVWMAAEEATAAALRLRLVAAQMQAEQPVDLYAYSWEDGTSYAGASLYDADAEVTGQVPYAVPCPRADLLPMNPMLPALPLVPPAAAYVERYDFMQRWYSDEVIVPMFDTTMLTASDALLVLNGEAWSPDES